MRSWLLKKTKGNDGKTLDLVNTASGLDFPYSLYFPNQKPTVNVNWTWYKQTADPDGLGVTYEFSDGHVGVRKAFKFQKSSYLSMVSTEVTLDGKPLPHMIQWRGGFGDSEEERQLRGKAASSLTRYHERFRSEEAQPVWFERPFAFRLGPHHLRAGHQVGVASRGVLLYAADECVGYAYVAEGHIGPLAVMRKTALDAAFRTALKLASSCASPHVTAHVPGPCEAGLTVAIEHRLRITFPMLLMSTREFGNWTQYLPRNGGFM